MIERIDRDSPSMMNPLSLRGQRFREECSKRGHELYAGVRDWMESNGGPPSLDGDAEEQQRAIDYACSNVFHLLARLTWTAKDTAQFERYWPVALESPEFCRTLRRDFPKVEAFFEQRREQEAQASRSP